MITVTVSEGSKPAETYEVSGFALAYTDTDGTPRYVVRGSGPLPSLDTGPLRVTLMRILSQVTGGRRR